MSCRSWSNFQTGSLPDTGALNFSHLRHEYLHPEADVGLLLLTRRGPGECPPVHQRINVRYLRVVRGEQRWLQLENEGALGEKGPAGSGIFIVALQGR